jgi:hypothetical protein
MVLPRGDDQFLELGGPGRQGVHDDLERERLALDPADRLERGELADLVGQVGGRQAVG